MKKPMSLRSMFGVLTLAVTLLAVMVCTALVVLSTALHHTVLRSAASVESVRLAEEAELALLLHARAADPIVRQELEGNLRGLLLEAQRFVATRDEADMLATAERHVDAYLDAARDPRRAPAQRAAAQEAAYGSLDTLVAINVAESKLAQQQASRWDRLANTLGIGIGALLVAGAGLLLAWLKRRAFKPVIALASAMGRFARGHLDARAAEEGPRELREMCVRFNEMAAALIAQRQEQMALLGGVAHDLKTPLSAVRLSVELLARDVRVTSLERSGAIVGRLGHQLTRMERMLGDFLDVAKVDAGQLELRFDVHDVRGLVQGVMALFEGATEEHRLLVRTPRHPVLLRCDALRVEQVITNLLSNAIKYSPPGSDVEVAIEPQDDELVVRVSDQGVGMTEQEQASIFEPFRRGTASALTTSGAGLGLFVVAKLVAAHRGRITVESGPGRGSTFRVHLPRAPELREPASQPQPPPSTAVH